MGRTPTISFARHPAIENIYSLVEGAGCRIDAGALPESFRAGAVKVVVNTVAAQGATTVAVNALGAAIPLGATLSFDAGEFAKLTAPAPLGATSLTVEALVNGLEVNDTAIYSADNTASKVIPALTVMSYVAGGQGLALPRSVTGGNADFVLASEYVEGAQGVGYTGYGSYVQGNFYENLLPDAVPGTPATLPQPYKDELKARAGTFLFFTYRDSRAN